MKTNVKRTSLILVALVSLLGSLAACDAADVAPAEVRAELSEDAAPADTAIETAAEAESSSEAAYPVEGPAAPAVEAAYPVEEQGEAAAPPAEIAAVAEDGSTSLDAGAVEAALSQYDLGSLSQAEAEGLLFMREEEKLARDVYLTLYEQWDQPVFSNIANSEQTHTDAVKTLLDRYNLEDPAAGLGVGEFANPELQALYDSLVAQGSASLAEALRVGAAIEEIDILDLDATIAETDQEDIRLVYENLRWGSENHLRAFVSVLERQEGPYQAQYLDQEAYEAIVSASSGRGRAGGQGQGRGNN